jgi:hypothetical protein
MFELKKEKKKKVNKEWRNKSLKASVCILPWSASIYPLRRHKNDLRHGKMLQEVVY